MFMGPLLVAFSLGISQSRTIAGISNSDVEHVADEDVEEDELDELVLVFSLMIAS